MVSSFQSFQRGGGGGLDANFMWEMWHSKLAARIATKKTGVSTKSLHMSGKCCGFWWVVVQDLYARWEDPVRQIQTNQPVNPYFPCLATIKHA